MSGIDGDGVPFFYQPDRASNRRFGRYVAYESAADDFVAGDGNGFTEFVDETIFHEYKEFDGFKSPTKMTILQQA